MTPAAIADLMARAYVWQSPWSAPAVADTLNGPFAHLWHESGSVLLAQAIGDEAEILAIAVAPENQRQGRAKRLLGRCHADLTKIGVTRIVLEVAAPNTPAQRLYQAMGYVPAGHRSRYYRQTDGTWADAIVMAREF